MPRSLAPSVRRLFPLLLVLLGTPVFAGSPAHRHSSSKGCATMRKVIAPRGALAESAGVELWHDYGAYALYRVTSSALRNLPPATRDRLTLADEMNRVLFDAYPFDTQKDVLTLPPDLRIDDPAGFGLQLIQFVGPIQGEWLAAVRGDGAEPIHYVARNAYLAWTGDAGRQALDDRVESGELLQFSIPFHPYFKLGPALRSRLGGRTEPVDPEAPVPVVIQMLRHAGRHVTEERIADLALGFDSPWTPILRFQNRYATVRLGDVAQIAGATDVTWIGERLPRELADEVQAQIVAGNLNGGQSAPASPGYKAFLDGLGFSHEADEYPIVDVADDGIGNGTVQSGDRTLHVAGSFAEPTRLVYVDNCTAAANGGSPGGHGHLNANIIGGYDLRDGSPFQDPDGFQRALGVNPYVRLGGTRIFAPSFDVSACGGTDTGLIRSIQDRGAMISSNSWGCSGCSDLYDDSSQAFDVGVRDADLTEPGNQQLVFVFSAGNEGPDAVSVRTPGNGKNVITVGASENHRPEDEDGEWIDGCGYGPADADDAMEVAVFSSHGPAPGGRVKPEVLAPGTHVQGTASSHPGYNGLTVCDIYRPSGQQVFAASTGTSFACPAVSGLSSLIWWWIENGHAGDMIDGDGGTIDPAAPSPALVKAYLMAHPTYLTGAGAGDDLPSNAQGYGLPNMGRLFDSLGKVIADQTTVFDDSGETWKLVVLVDDPGEPVRITLAYTDEAGAIGTSPQVNDLDLSVEAGGSLYLGNVMSGRWSVPGGAADRADNYEAVFLAAGAEGVIEVTVTAFNVGGDGVPESGDETDQDFALVCANCRLEPVFTLDVSPPNLEVCAPGEAVFQVDVGSVLGFSDPVTLSVGGGPAGSSAGFDVNPVTPPGVSQLSIGDTGAAAPGSYALELTAAAGGFEQTAEMSLVLADAVPAAPALLQPADGAADLAVAVSFAWTPSAQAASYVLEIATDPGFADVFYSATESGTGHELTGFVLDPATEYFWRVRGQNACGDGTDSPVFSVTTRAVPPVLLVDDDDDSPDVRSFYTDALDALAVAYDVWDTANSDDEPGTEILGPFAAVVWFTGAESGDMLEPGYAGPGPEGEAALASFLDQGGCLFLSSQDYLLDRGGLGGKTPTGFMTDYLGLASGSSYAGQSVVTGAGPVFGDFGTHVLSYPFANFSDALLPDGSAEVVFYGDQGEAAISKDGGAYRTSYWGFPFAALPDPEIRAAALRRVLEDLCGVAVPIFADGFESGDTSAW